MKITFLGTAAAEAIPALWCECEVCDRALRLGGREVRRRCSYLVDDDTMIDFGPDSFGQSVEFGVDLRKLDRLLVTHPHSDHLAAREFLWRTRGYSRVTKRLAVIGSPSVFGAIVGGNADQNVCRPEDLMLIPVEAKAGVALESGDLGILPLAANHMTPAAAPLIYVISRHGKNVLIANDTGYFPEESWRTLARVRLDAAVLESCGGAGKPELRDGHMGLRTTVACRDRLLELGALVPESPVVANHFSHNCGNSHDELVAAFGAHGIAVAYDGMVLSL